MILKLLTITCLIPVGLAAQSLDRTVLSNGGNFQTDPQNTLTLSSTIGEPVVMTQTATTLLLTQGFQQPDAEIVTSVAVTANGNLESGVWPNPFENQLNIWFNSGKSRDLIISLTDMAGRKVLADREINVTQGSSSCTIQLSGFAAGIYLLRIQGANEELTAVHRISKSH